MARDDRGHGTSGTRLDQWSSLGISSLFLVITMLRTCSYSFQGRTIKNAGWDFSIGGSQSAGTVRALKPPQSRERRQEVTSDQSFQKSSRASASQLSSTSGAVVPEISEGGFLKRDSYQNDCQEEVRSFASCGSRYLVDIIHCLILVILNFRMIHHSVVLELLS